MNLIPSPKTKSKIILGLWAILPALLGISLASLAVFALNNSDIWKIIHPNDNLRATAQAISAKNQTGIILEEKSKYFYLNKDENGGPKVSAKAYLVGDLNTGEVILSKNQDQKFPIASLSKLMTALVTREISSDDDIAKVSKRALDTKGKNGGLYVGEKIKTADLIYPLLLESSNDAAEVIAEYFGRDTFIKKMNQEAQNLKMSGTFYNDPSGLSQNNQSTVSDIFKLTGYLNQQKQDLIQITGSRSFSNKRHSWSNISQFLHYDGYFGGKSGYTDAALQTVVSLFSLPLGKTGLRPVAITLLSSPDRIRDVSNILKYLKKNIYYGGAADANTDWVALKVGSPDIKDPNFVTISFAGDIMLDRGVKNSVIKNFNNDYSRLFEKPDLINELKKSDIVFANLEGTASDKGSDGGSLYSFRMDPAVTPALAGAGISILSVANNHVGDFGREAYVDTLDGLKENEIRYTGGGMNVFETEQPTIIEKYGMKIGYLGFSDQGPDFMQASQNKAGILAANNPRFDEIIKNARKQVDFLVVYFHFGDEYEAKHNARQEFLAHRAVDDGAKIIIGSHPHVIEDTEVYKDSYIAYSLGNFIFDQAFSEQTMTGLLLNVKLDRDGNLTVRKDTVKLNKAFQPDTVVKGKEEKITLQVAKAE